MGMSEKTAVMRGNFLVVCEQYEAMAKLLQKIGEAKNRVEAHNANKLFFEQFQEIGEQLKVLGGNIDSFRS